VRTRRTPNPTRTLSDRAAWRVGFVHFQGKAAPRPLSKLKKINFFLLLRRFFASLRRKFPPPRTRQPALPLNHFP